MPPIGPRGSRPFIWKERSIASCAQGNGLRANPFRPRFSTHPRPRESAVISNREPILDPFSVYEKSPELLAQELTALRGWHLRRIIRDFDLVAESDAKLDTLTEPQLGALIMRRVGELRG